MILDFASLNANQLYKVMSYSIFPRPIAWIVTEDEGVVNVAPFSYFIPLTSQPPVLVVSIGKKEDGSPKDTLANLLKHKKATICLPHDTCIEDITNSSQGLPHEVSEATEFNIELVESKEGFPPMVKGIKCAYFVTFRETHPIEGSSTTPVLLDVDSAYFEDGKIDEKLNISLENIGRVGHYFIKDYTLTK